MISADRPRAGRVTAPPAPAGSRAGAGHLLLALAVALTAASLFVLAPIEPLVYDEVWHVFIARQDAWGAFRAEMAPTAHPPAFFLVLKAAAAVFGAHPLAYRLVSIVATLGSTWLVGRIVQRTTGQPGLAAAAALAFGTSLTAVTVGLEVRSYALATCWMLAACLALVELVENAGAGPRRARVGFAVAASLALVTHYGTALFLLACFAAAAVPALVDRDYRRRLLDADRGRWRAHVLTFGAPAAVLAVTYALHVGLESKPGFRALRAFLFDPGREDVFEFVWRNTRALFELFVPALEYPTFRSLRAIDRPALPEAAVAGLLIAALAAVAWLGFRPGGRDGGVGAARRVPAVLLPAMTALIVVLAVLGRYPYGGRLRHQSFLFPFAVIVLALAIGELARRAGHRLRGRRGARLLPALAAGLLAVAVAVNAAHWLSRFEVPKGVYHRRRMEGIFERFPDARTIYVDQYNLIHLFQHHQDRRWRYQRRARGAVDVWRVGDAGDGELLVCRPGRRWQLDLSAEGTYRGLVNCLDATGDRRAMVLREQWIGGRAGWPVERTEQLARRAAAPFGLVPEEIVVDGEDVYAAFIRRGTLSERSTDP